ncbi:MAG: restriction endonuclease subunit S [Sulfurimonas sp.]|jgi:type I restriction enzyme S subunit
MSEMIQVPDGWEVKKVSSLCKILDNQRIPLNDEERQNMKGHIPYYGANAIVDYIDSYLFDEDLILLAEDGGNFDEYENRPISFKISGKSWVNNHAHILKPNKNVEFDYVFYSLEHKNITSYIRGGTRSKLNQSDLRDVDVLIPKEKKEQEKIAKILSTLDKNIESTNCLIEKEKNIKKALMQELLTNGIDKDGHIRTRAIHAYKESELGLIPDEWEIVSLGKCIKNNGDYGINAAAVNLSYSLPTYLRITDIDGDGHFIEADKKSVDSPESGNFILNDGDIVFARTGNTTGKTYLYNSKDGKLVFAGFLIRFTPNQKKLIPHYLKATTETFSYWSWVETNSARTGQPGINANEYKSFKFKLPSIEEQKQIAKILTTQDKKIETEETNLAKLKELKKGLMNDLLSGKVRVNV